MLLLPQAFWSPLHEPGWPQPFHVRGPTYLSDRAKVPAGSCAFTLLAVDLVSTSDAAHHIARFLPSVRCAPLCVCVCKCVSARCVCCDVKESVGGRDTMLIPVAPTCLAFLLPVNTRRPSLRPLRMHPCTNTPPPLPPTHTPSCTNRRARAASCFVINLMVPTAADVLNLVMTFGSAQPFPAPAPASAVAAAAPPPGSDSDDGGISSGFVHALQRFLAAGDGERSHVLKLIPRIQVGPWMLQQAVGTTPVIVGRKLQTSFHCTGTCVRGSGVF